MANTDAIATRPSTAVATVPGDAERELVALVATIPNGDEDPTESMLAHVMNAAVPGDWNAIFEADSIKDMDGKQVRINAIRSAASTFPDGLPFFLVVDATDLKTGERGVFTCGSKMAVAQLANAYRTGNLPVEVEIVRKATPTKRGFHPIHLRYIGKTEAPLGDPSKLVSEQ